MVTNGMNGSSGIVEGSLPTSRKGLDLIGVHGSSRFYGDIQSIQNWFSCQTFQDAAVSIYRDIDLIGWISTDGTISFIPC